MTYVWVIVLVASAYGYTGRGYPHNPEFRRVFTEQEFCQRFIRRYPTALKRGFPLNVDHIECERMPVER